MNRLGIISNTIAKTLNSKSWDIMYSANDDSAERVFAKPYSKSSIVYTCISTTARAISQVPLLLMQKTGTANNTDIFRRRGLNIENRRYILRQDPREPLRVIERSTTTGNVDLWEQAPDNNPWQQLINKPNYLLSGQQFKEAMIGHLLLDGNVWVVGMPFSSAVIPDTLWVIQKKYIEPYKNKLTGHVEYWNYDPTGRGVQAKDKIKIYLKERIAHSKLWNPEDPVLGLSPLEPSKTPMMGDWKASKYNEKVFDNDGTPGGTLETDQKMQPTQVEKMRNDWKQEHQGYKKSHRLAILHTGLKYHQTAVTNRDMEYMEFRKYTRDEIIQALGMKKGVISITDSLNYATFLGQKREWWESTNIPHCKNIESALDTGMLKEDPNQKFMFDLATVKALQEDFSEKTKQAKDYWLMGVPFDDINQRLELGFNEIEGGNTGWLPYSVQPVAFSLEPPEPEVIVEPAPAIEPPEEDDKDKTILLRSTKRTEITDPAFERWEKRTERIWKRVTNQSNKIERPFKKKLQSIFFEMRKNILSILHHGVPGKSKKSVSITKDINIEEINRYNFLIERELLKKSSKGYFDLSIAAGAESIIDEIGEGDIIPANDPIVIGFITDKQTKIVSVVDTVKSQLEKQLRIAVKEGEDVTLMEQRIKKTFGLANHRAATIARTEMGGAMNFGRSAQINRSSFKFKIWYTAQDERVRGADEEVLYNHVSMHGEKIAIGPNAQWDVEGDYLDYPGDYKGQPGNIINCIVNSRTPVFTSKGWKQIRKIQIGDLVLTHKNRFKKVERVKNRKYDGNVVKLIPKDKKQNSILVTPEHQFMMEDGTWQDAKNIKIGNKVNIMAAFCARCGTEIPYWRKYCSRTCLSKDITDKQWSDKKHRENMSKKTSEQLKKEYKNGIRDRFTIGKVARMVQKEKYGKGGYLGFMANDKKFRKKIRDSINKKYGSTFNMLKQFAFPALGKVNRGMSKIEIAMSKFLAKKAKKYIAQFSIGRRRIDFYIPKERLFIECDGIQFHKDIQKERKRDLEILTKYPDHKIAHVTYGTGDKGNPKWEFFDLISLNHTETYKQIAVEIIDIQKFKLKKPRRIYNFAVEDDESYIVKGFVTHNCRCIEVPDTEDF